MNNWKNDLRFDTYDDIQNSLKALIRPLKSFYQERPGHLKLGTHGTVYKEDTRQVEAYLRILWGIGPLLTQADAPDLQELYLNGIVAGTNPNNPNYWGEVTDYDQLLVEMASLATTFMLAKEKTWDKLSRNNQENLANWLRQINRHTMPSNNWHFFRVLVNICLKKMGVAYSEELIESDLALMDSYYAGNGWYYDGEKAQRDYYIPWAFHYYSLIYAKVMTDEDPVRAKLFKDRARKFTLNYRYLFDADGAGIPFGRSLSYRFAQAAFFAALTFADVEALPWGEIKGLYARNMTYWLQQDILTTDGLLSVGYAYENLVMAEGYNAPGSPYWSFKSFLMLAVPKNHPYWQSEKKPLSLPKNKIISHEGRALYEHTAHHHHALMYPFGQTVIKQNHKSAKYSKFVYSTKFGFSVPKSSYYYYEGALDNVLSVSEDGYYFRPKSDDLSFNVTEDWVNYVWQPYPNVTIDSTIVPCGDYHVRIHQIETGRPLEVCEAGFSNCYEDEARVESKTLASYCSSVGLSEITAISGFEDGQAVVIRPEPNTNLLYERTLMPVLQTKVAIGKHLLVSLVGGILKEAIQSDKPIITVEESQTIVSVAGEEVIISYDHG